MGNRRTRSFPVTGVLSSSERIKCTSKIRCRTLFFCTAFFALGCAAELKYTPNASPPPQAKPDNCSIDVLTTRPQRSFEELGVIDFTGGSVNQYTGGRIGVPNDASELKKKAGPLACRAGGDAMLAEVNGVGQYIRATVIRYKPD